MCIAQSKRVVKRKNDERQIQQLLLPDKCYVFIVKNPNAWAPWTKPLERVPEDLRGYEDGGRWTANRGTRFFFWTPSTNLNVMLLRSAVLRHTGLSSSR